jgi:hypothetical protein
VDPPRYDYRRLEQPVAGSNSPATSSRKLVKDPENDLSQLNRLVIAIAKTHDFGRRTMVSLLLPHRPVSDDLQTTLRFFHPGSNLRNLQFVELTIVSAPSKFYGQAERAISTGKLQASLLFHILPINQVVFLGPS